GERVQQLQPVETAALQPDVEKDQVRPARLDRRHGVVAVAGGAGVVAFVLKDAGDQLADIGFVVDNEDIGRHLRCSQVWRVPGGGALLDRFRPARAGGGGKPPPPQPPPPPRNLRGGAPPPGAPPGLPQPFRPCRPPPPAPPP